MAAAAGYGGPDGLNGLRSGSKAVYSPVPAIAIPGVLASTRRATATVADYREGATFGARCQLCPGSGRRLNHFRSRRCSSLMRSRKAGFKYRPLIPAGARKRLNSGARAERYCLHAKQQRKVYAAPFGLRPIGGRRVDRRWVLGDFASGGGDRARSGVEVDAVEDDGGGAGITLPSVSMATYVGSRRVKHQQHQIDRLTGQVRALGFH
jgi:hypothetical protein